MTTGDRPSDLKPLIEVAAETGVAYSTIRYWQQMHWVGKWKRGGRSNLASVSEVRRFAEEPRLESGASQENTVKAE